LAIKYLKHNQVDFKKWDDCIRNSINGNLYGFTWYLNIVSKGWDALILDDYVAVMPLTHKKKSGIPVVIQPFFAQQLGVFSIKANSPEMIAAFIDAIPPKFKYILYNLNKYNNYHEIHRKNHNFELDLIFPHDQLVKKYNENTRRNIGKAKQSKYSIESNKCSVEEFIRLVKNNVGVKVENLPQKEYQKISKIIEIALEGKFGEIISINNQDNHIMAAVFFVFSHKKAIYLFAASTEEGKEKRAMFILIDEFIKKYSEKNLILDFEGSNLEGLARFYQGFGAIDCEYITIKKNRLPFPLKFFKK
jgi:hypothetical protein